jgi:hypothetical protein
VSGDEDPHFLRLLFHCEANGGFPGRSRRLLEKARDGTEPIAIHDPVECETP